MPSILPDYEYDIFISYRHNDNRTGGVTEFVEYLKAELAATIKESLSIYFDSNPHDGLLENHDVDKSLEGKLKCLILIPIISQTYCDRKSFAWQHEFVVFNKRAQEDDLGRDIKLSNGNVASRILPIKIHDLDMEDTNTIENEIGGVLRSIEFIYKEPGVNRPLATDDSDKKNLNGTLYKNQVNKVANAVKEIIQGINNKEQPVLDRVEAEAVQPKSKTKRAITVAAVAVFLLLVAVYFLTPERKVSTAEPEQLEKSIAVLPFANTKPDLETDYLGFAIANQIIGDLVYNSNITVRPSSAVRKYDKQVFDVAEVADDLKVEYVLTGNYLKVSNIIRLDIELVQARTNEGIWHDEVEIDFNNSFELQDIVAQKVVEGLNIQFTLDEINRIKKDIAKNPLAYEYYLKGVSYPFTVEGNQLAIEMLNKSIELDASYSPAYSELGSRFLQVAYYESFDSVKIKQAEKLFQEALSINMESISALTGLAQLYAESGRINEAVKVIRQALNINPNNADAHFSLGYIYRYAGMNEESILEMEKAVSIDPKNPNFRSLSLSYYNMGEYEKALDYLKMVESSDWTIGMKGFLFFKMGENEQALAIYDRIISTNPDGFWGLNSAFYKAILQGNNEKALQTLRKREQMVLSDSEPLYYTAAEYALVGDREGCNRVLNMAVEGGYFNYPLMLTDTHLDLVRDDPGFKKILEKARTKHEAFKAEYF